MRPRRKAESRGTIRGSPFRGRCAGRRSCPPRIARGPRWIASSRSEMRVALTGSSGLIGSAVAAALRSAEHEVLVLGRGADAALQFDVANPRLVPGALRGCGALVHCAGVTDEDLVDRAT